MYLKILILVCLAFQASNINAAASGDESEGAGSSAVSKAVSGGGTGAASTEETVKDKPGTKVLHPLSFGAKATRVMKHTGGGAEAAVTEGGTLGRAGTTGATARFERVEDEKG